MLEKYKKQVPSFYEKMSLVIKNNRLSHAYLIEISNNDNYIDIIMALVIDILKIKGNDQLDYEKLIKNGSYADFFVVSPVNSRWIKKEQILFLQEKYKVKSFYNNKKIYIIDKADDLNIASCNTLLKFLEEPADDIVAILLSKNHYNVIPTILSRCQLISMDRQIVSSNYSIQDKVVKFIKLLCVKKDSIFAYLNSIDFDFENKVELEMFLEEIIKFYGDLSRFLLKKELLYYNDYESVILEVSENENIKSISMKILKMDVLMKDLDFNINSRLFMDELIMILIGVDIDV